MTQSTFSMIPCVFSVSLKNVGGRIVCANQATLLPTGLTSRRQHTLPSQSRMSRPRYSEAAMPRASWPEDRRPDESGCNPTHLNRLTKPATKG